MSCCSYISAISSLCVSVVGGLVCSTLAGSVCTLCYAVGQLSVSHMLTASARHQAKQLYLSSCDTPVSSCCMSIHAAVLRTMESVEITVQFDMYDLV